MRLIFSENMKKTIIEELSELEHKQWEEWSKDISKKEDLSSERVERWKKYWIDYKELPEDVKEEDRKYARKVFEIVEKYMEIKK